MKIQGIHTRLGWNSLERLPKDQEHEDETIHLREGFLPFLEKVFIQSIGEDRIELNTIVKRVCIHEDQGNVTVEVLTSDEQIRTYRADHVVCTQSVGCLKQSMHQVFLPALPHAKRMAIQRLGFGTINKVC